jgi:hypothetical protein
LSDAPPLRRRKAVVYGGDARRDSMIRTVAFIVAGLMLATQVASAQGPLPETEDNRYTFNRV